LKKSDSADAEGLAQLARMNWFTLVHIRSEVSDRLCALIGGRERLIWLRKDLEGNILGVVKAFGIRIIGINQAQQRQDFRNQPAVAGETEPVLLNIATHLNLCEAHDCRLSAPHIKQNVNLLGTNGGLSR
jgi:transposase